MNIFSQNGRKTEYHVSYDKTKRILRVESIENFNLNHTFKCGQCFRWFAEEDGSYTGVAGGRAVTLRLNDKVLQIENCGAGDFESFWYDYLDLGRDYGTVKRHLSENDEVMRRAVEFGGGIRLLHQDPWETVVSFIISQNSNIPRIQKCVDVLCRNFGKPVGIWRDKPRFAFPTAKRLAELSVDDLAVCRLGYRDKYVIGTARAVAEDGGRRLAALRAAGDSADLEDARDYVRSLYGVGPKVADCILLFGLLRYESFPLDVWMKRILSQLYGFERSDVKGMAEYARVHFGEFSGFAQQYLFYYAKEHL